MAAWAPDHPHDALPLLPPAADLESKPVLKRCVTARAALAELKQAAELIPNPGMLINTLPVLEARAAALLAALLGAVAWCNCAGRCRAGP